MIHIITQHICYVMYGNMNILYLIANVLNVGSIHGRPSQSISKTPLQPWIITARDGNILYDHCTCMAGSGEVCTHVGAVLFFVSSAIEIRSSRTVTQEKAYWLLPSGTKGINYEQVEDITFKSAKSLKKDSDCAISQTPPNKQTKPMTLPDVPPPTDDELTTLFRGMHESGKMPVILSFIRTMLRVMFRDSLVRSTHCYTLNFGMNMRFISPRMNCSTSVSKCLCHE